MSKVKTITQSAKTRIKPRAYILSVRTINFLATIPYNTMSRIIINQLSRSITSIGANIIEAKSSSSKRDFKNFYQIALKSANESMYWFCLLRDVIQPGKETIQELIKELTEVSNIIGASIITMKKKRL